MNKLHEQKSLLNNIINIARQAAQEIMKIYEGSIEIKLKDDSSPITTADTASHYLILEKLTELTPAIPVISEEGELLEKNYTNFWLVDPLDGTKEFIQQSGEFTVNIAYIENKQPKFGVVCAPALDLIYAGLVGDGAFKIYKDNNIVPIQIQPNPMDNEDIIIVGSRNHGDPVYMEKFLSKFTNNKLLPIGSSLKFCKVAEGAAHIYPRFGRTMEWDTAAGQAVLVAAGGFVSSLNGESLLYGKKGFENPPFIACASHKFLEIGV